jgi:hypothetical protein
MTEAASAENGRAADIAPPKARKPAAPSHAEVIEQLEAELDQAQERIEELEADAAEAGALIAALVVEINRVWPIRSLPIRLRMELEAVTAQLGVSRPW